MDVEKYISKHQLVQIGTPPNDYICCDVVVDTPDELMVFIQNSEYYISCIRWWDYVKNGCVSHIGYGGTKDPKHSDYYFAETDILKEFDSTATITDYRNYIVNIKKQYARYQIFPAFDIKKRNNQSENK